METVYNMGYKTYLQRHPELIIWRALPLEAYGLERVPFGLERGLLANWSADYLWIEVRSLASGKIVGKYPIHPLAGVVIDKPWLRDGN